MPQTIDKLNAFLATLTKLRDCSLGFTESRLGPIPSHQVSTNAVAGKP